MAAPDRFKVHKHLVSLGGRDARVLRLRPENEKTFATNYFHETWHVLSDPGGARLLGRICWALSYQRQPDTVFVLDRPEVVGNPFDGDPSGTVVITNSELGPFNSAMATDLRGWLRKPHPSDGTVVFQTHGLTTARADQDAFWDGDDKARWKEEQRRQKTWISRVNGCVVLAAPAAVLRSWAVDLSDLGQSFWQGSDYTSLDYPYPDGEVQVFPDFTRRASRARIARERLFPGRSHELLAPAEREAVWALTAEADRQPSAP